MKSLNPREKCNQREMRAMKNQIKQTRSRPVLVESSIWMIKLCTCIYLILNAIKMCLSPSRWLTRTNPNETFKHWWHLQFTLLYYYYELICVTTINRIYLIHTYIKHTIYWFVFLSVHHFILSMNFKLDFYYPFWYIYVWNHEHQIHVILKLSAASHNARSCDFHLKIQ